MSNLIGGELNKYFEIIGLLYNSCHADFMEKGLWESVAAEHGINGTELYQKFGLIHKKYCMTFQKNIYRPTLPPAGADFDFFFGDEEADFLFLVQVVCAEQRGWFAGAAQEITEEEIMLAFVRELELPGKQEITAVPTMNELVVLLQQTRYSARVCWKLLLLLQSPRQKLTSLIYFVQKNIPAYEKAVAAIQKPLGRLLADFPDDNYLSSAITQNAGLTPVLIYPAVEIVGSGATYIGLFVKDVYKMIAKAKSSRQNLLPVLKALSDSSKFDILRSLLIAPKYNLELAAELNLTAATVSHHMNVLLTNQLVNVEKKDGRVYYTLAKDTLRDLIAQLTLLFSLEPGGLATITGGNTTGQDIKS